MHTKKKKKNWWKTLLEKIVYKIKKLIAHLFGVDYSPEETDKLKRLLEALN